MTFEIKLPRGINLLVFARVFVQHEKMRSFNFIVNCQCIMKALYVLLSFYFQATEIPQN
jgi:hypothetical protein